MQLHDDSILLQVTYQTDSFLDKNRDYIVVEHCNLLSSSQCSFISGLFASLPESSRSSYKFSSVASRFKVKLAHAEKAWFPEHLAMACIINVSVMFVPWVCDKW